MIKVKCVNRSSGFRARSLVALATFSTFAACLASCGGDATSPSVVTGFLAGTSANHQIGVVVNSTGKAITLFQLGSPTTEEQIALGTSSTITPTTLSVRGRLAAVPLGDAASVALVDLQNAVVRRYFTFASGNATGSTFVDDSTILAANLLLGTVGRMTVSQATDAITPTIAVAPQPTAMAFDGTRALVVSANLDQNYEPIGNGIVTAINPKTMQVLGTVATGGTNPQDATIGPDGLLYVVNTGDYVSDASLTIINPSTMQVVTTVGGMGVGAGAISIDANGLAYVSGVYSGTLVWDTKSRTFVRGAGNAVCAKLPDGSCRGAFAAATDASGDLYQAFFGSASQAPYLFVYKPGTFTLTDSVAAGVGPSDLLIRTF